MSHFDRFKTKIRFSLVLVVVVVLLCNFSHSKTIEDEYNWHFGNHSRYRRWTVARKWYIEDDEPVMKKFCAESHRRAGKGSYSVDWLVMKKWMIQFKNPKYMARWVDVVEYSTYVEGEATTEATTKWKYKESGDKWQITEGTSPDCVYYLSMDNVSGPIFSLKEKVCGIKIVDDTIRVQT